MSLNGSFQQNKYDSHSGREVVNSRMFNAPAENVFKAFSDPGLLKKWWGPKGFSNTIHEFDMRLGGIWRYVGPNGVDYPK